MILDSFDNAEEDIAARQVIEAKNEAETILAAVEKGRTHAAWQQLTSDEIANIRSRKITQGCHSSGDDYKVIRKAIEHLDKATRRFAEIMMDSAVTGAIGGKTMQSPARHSGTAPAPPPLRKAEFSGNDNNRTCPLPRQHRRRIERRLVHV